jgi:hypothetical protein
LGNSYNEKVKKRKDRKKKFKACMQIDFKKNGK